MAGERLELDLANVCAIAEGGTIHGVSFQAFDALIHFTYEASWVFYSTFGRTVNGSEGPLAEMCTSTVL